VLGRITTWLKSRRGYGAGEAASSNPAAGGTTRYFVGEGTLYRERSGWCGELLSGDRWLSIAIDMTRVHEIDEARARELANGTPLDAPNGGISEYSFGRM